MSDVVSTLQYGETWAVEGGVKRGETWDFALRWQAGTVEGVVTYVDLSAYTIRCSIRRKDEPETSPALITLESANGITLSEANERADFRVLPAQTELLTAKKWYKGDIRLESISQPTAVVRFPLRNFEFLAKESQTDGE